jgi:hypothetical protein
MRIMVDTNNLSTLFSDKMVDFFSFGAMNEIFF